MAVVYEARHIVPRVSVEESLVGARIAPPTGWSIERIVEEVKRLGITTIIVEQNALAALELAERAIIVDMGEILFTGTAREVLDNRELRDAYPAI